MALVVDAELLITTPQLLLDALCANYLSITQFCSFTLIECQLFGGSHPYLGISEHLFNTSTRILGLCTPWNRKYSDDNDTIAAALPQLMSILDADSRDLSNHQADQAEDHTTEPQRQPRPRCGYTRGTPPPFSISTLRKA